MVSCEPPVGLVGRKAEEKLRADDGRLGKAADVVVKGLGRMASWSLAGCAGRHG